MVYDFIDLGCGIGGSIEWSKYRFGGKSHLGIDNRIHECKIAQEKGHNVILGDVTSDAFELPNAKYITMLHFLEHLKNEKEVENMIKKSIAAANEFIFIKGPFFDSTEFLKTLGFKITWTDWIGHPTAVTTNLLKSIMEKFDLQYEIGYLMPVFDSTSHEIVPTSAPIDTIRYDDSMGKKEYVNFIGIYREIYCYINVSCTYWNDLIKTKIY
jgi:hypothetical protein